MSAAIARCARFSPTAAATRDHCAGNCSERETAPILPGRLEVGNQLVDHRCGEAAQPGGSNLTTQRGLAGVVPAGSACGARNRDQLAAEALRALADLAVELPREADGRDARGDLVAPDADRSKPLPGSVPACRCTFGIQPCLSQFAAEGGDLDLDVERKTGIGRGRLDLCRLQLALAHHLGKADPAVGHLGEPSGEARPFRGRPMLRLRRVGHIEHRQTFLVDRHGRQAGAGVSEGAIQVPKPGACDPEGTGGAPLRADPIHGLADSHEGLRRGHPAPGVGETLDRLLQLARPLARALRRVNAEAVIAEPCRRAEDRLVDPEMESARGYGTPAAQLVGQLRSSELEHLHRLLAGVEAARNPDSTPVIELVGERKTVAAARPGLVARPVAAIDGTTLAAGVDAVQGAAHRPEQRRLAGLVAPGDDCDPRMQFGGQVVEAAEAGDLETFEDHRNPTSAPESAISP